ncbi:PAS domain-containing sensor histidine kinase [Ferrovibrio sp.]|uniref:sensor histidine kinase n=1 Tax=Ferrovibrio sp. TaxID=1917215 RepID=UPI00261EFAA8|nr:PAS domain-containing sensor histidine kinase [Ferrovibrio sp.]
MVIPTIAVAATAAPLIVALACLFAYRKLGGGRHLLFWAIAHAGLPIPFAIIGFSSWPLAPDRVLSVISVAVILLSAVMLASGIRVQTGRNDRLEVTLAVAVALTICTLLVQQLTGLTYPIPTVIGAACLLYAGTLLMLHRRSALYFLTGLLLLARGCMAVYYAIGLSELGPQLNGALSGSIFANLLTGLGLMMIEFDNARQREHATREDEQETRKFLEALMDAMPATMTYKDSDLRYRLANRAVRELLKPFNTDPIGRTWSEIAGPEAAAVVDRQDRAILDTGESLHMEQGWTGPDGKPIIALAQKVPLKDEDGRVVGIITCGIDITRLKETEVQLIEQREAAETASRAKTAFLANMSHELRTPLNAIIGFAEMMAVGYTGTLTPRQQDYAINIRQSGEHLLRLVNDILDLSRLENGRVELNITECDFDTLAQSALAMVEPQAREGGIKLAFTPCRLTVRADERALIQILVNLMGNAVKFNRPEGSVSLQASSKAGVVSIRVEDTGIGMSDAESRSATQPFHRIDAYRARANSGAGLGLSICRSLVELHGGRLEIRSRAGAGTCVEVLLPA